MSQNEITKKAMSNYSNSSPWPKDDVWHSYTYSYIKNLTEQWLSICSKTGMKILNAGSGGTEYRTNGTIIHLDIVEQYVSHFDEYLIGSIEDIALPNSSVDGIICVGSVLNYADAQRAILEFYRILKPDGFLILEFERSNSAEFLWTKQHGQYIFSKEYHYNHQDHLLWLYSEKHIRQLLDNYKFKIEKCKRFHSISSLLYRIDVAEEKAAPFSKLDRVFNVFSYPLAHNVMLLAKKIPSKWDYRYRTS